MSREALSGSLHRAMVAAAPVPMPVPLLSAAPRSVAVAEPVVAPRRPVRGGLTAAPNPVPVEPGEVRGQTCVYWTSSGTEWVEVRVGAPDGPLLSRSGPGNAHEETGPWLTDGTVLVLQDVSGERPLTAEHTLATVTVELAER